MKTVNDIRNEFLNYFAGQGHEIVESGPLVPPNDPTLMFTNAGMVQFKDVFTGKETRPYSRATTSQKCVRAGGKHNDLENVGYTARHHTFFEMLGNFSFGDYFKEDAIAFAWELCTKNYGLAADKLLVTVHSSDEEAAEIWKKVTGFSDDKIIRIPTDDNFWRMGDTGPCGPCTEIFYDHGPDVPGGPPGSADEDGDRFIEIWNNVFMQFEQVDAETQVPLPKPSIDTGMGLERIAAILQGVHSNYEIDLMDDIINHVADETGVTKDSDQEASHKVIADHLRAAAFLMADGVMPSNEGRGYVLRRIMRRGMRHAHLLGARDPLMHKLFPTLEGQMAEAYPELARAKALITETLKLEEERFKRTLDTGLKLLEEETAKVKNGVLPGEVAFKLYDTFGFPLDLTQDALRAQGITVDTQGFDEAMAEQKAKARAAWSGSGEAATEDVWYEVLDEVGATEFLGYETESAEAQILAVIKNGKHSNEGLGEGEQGVIITNQTPFYAESGGQVGDTGMISVNDEKSGFEAEVTNTTKALGKLFLHHVTVKKGTAFRRNVQMQVDHERRMAIRANHSATHLLHEALRRVLGEHVTQKGSLQDENRTRFDISHPKGVAPEEIAKVEELVNAEIAAGTAVETRVMPLEEARESGAMALFGEKYDDEVRVVAMGTEQDNKQFSIELCGGTHVKNTKEIERLKIIAESALSSGVRRIEAVTGARADDYEAGKEQEAAETLARLKAENDKLRTELSELGGAPAVPPEDPNVLAKDNKRLQKEIADLRRKSAAASTGEEDIKDIGGLKFAGKVLDGFSPRDLKPMADDLKARIGSGVIALVATNDGKASIVVGVTDDLTGQYSAVDLVRVGSEALGGKGGGGRPDMAQAGGPNADAANDAVAAIEKTIKG